MTPWNRPYNLVPYGWLPKLYHKVREALQYERWDIAYVSCPPFPQATVITYLKKQFTLPLVVDFRDAWTFNPYLKNKSLLNNTVVRLIFPMLERMVLFSTDGIILNTPSTLAAYQKKYPQLRSHMIMLPNGYDENDFHGFSSTVPSDEMTMVYCGRFGSGERNPVTFFKALQNMLRQGKKIKLQIIGDDNPRLMEHAHKLHIANHIESEGPKPHGEAIRAMEKCHVLILYQEKSESTVTPVAGKTYEYLRAGKAILAIAPPGDNVEIVKKHAKRYEITDHNLANIERALELLYADWGKGLLNKIKLPDSTYTDHYNRYVLTRKLADYFNLVCGNAKIK